MLVEHCADGLALLSVEGCLLYLSPRASAILGRSAEELIGHPWLEHVHPDDTAIVLEQRRRQRDDRSKAHAAEFRYQLPDGTFRWIENSALSLGGSAPIEGVVATLRDVTEHRKVREERRLLADRFATIFRVSPAAASIATLSGEILDINASACAVFGAPREEILGRTALELGMWADPDERNRMMEIFRRDGVVHNFETIFRRQKTSEVRHCLVSLAPLHGPEASEPRVLFVALDVTERKHAEERLKEALAVLDLAQAATHIGSWASDPEGAGTGWWSDEAKRIFGLTPEARDNHRGALASVVPPHDEAAVHAAGVAARHDGAPLSMAHRIMRPDGAERWVHELAAVRELPDRTPHLVGIAHGESRDAGEQIRESEDGYRILFEMSPLPMYIYDPANLAMQAVNPAALRHYGYSRAEFLALTLSDLVAQTSMRDNIKTIIRVGREWPWHVGIIEHRRKDGTSTWVDIFTDQLMMGDRPVRLSVMRDVTKERDLEEQLRQAQKMDAVGRFAGGVAHDFNNMLTAILGYSNLLLGSSLDAKARASVLEVRLAAERAASLTRQLLTFSRKQVLVPSVLDLRAVVRDLIQMLDRLIGDDIVIETDVPRELGGVKADRSQMEQVLMNLAVNARDAMPEGGRLLFSLTDVQVANAAEADLLELTPGPYVLLTVKDTGIGMNAAVRARIFEPFFTTKATGKGTGLGLATVHGIVAQSGGAIRVLSEPHHGTQFKIWLPRAADQECTLHPTASVEHGTAGVETILLVEDEEQVRRLAKNILEASGYTVLHAGSPGDATDVAHQYGGHIDLLLTDVMMRGGGGRELVVRLTKERPGLRSLYMSGYTEDALVLRSAFDGATAFLQKPFTPTQLVQKVREVLDLKA